MSLAIATLLLSLAAGEAAMRLWGRLNGIDLRLYMQELKNSYGLTPGLIVPDPELGWKLIPNAQFLATTSEFSVIYKINSQGLRDKEYPIIKPKGKIRLVALGDSFTFGEGIPYSKRFTDISERNLPNLEIINFGVPGYGLDQSILLFERKGLQFSPDFVILFINDPLTSRASGATSIIKNNFVQPVSAATTNSMPLGDTSTAYINRNDEFFQSSASRLTINSYLLSYLRYRLTLLKLRDKLQKDDQARWGPLCKKKASNYFPENKKYVTFLIGKLNEVCSKHGIKIMVINISPHSDFEYLKGIDDNIQYYNLQPQLAREKKKHPLTFKYDGHYNQHTNDFISKKLTEILKEKAI
jgi:hypothetical protein